MSYLSLFFLELQLSSLNIVQLIAALGLFSSIFLALGFFFLLKKHKLLASKHFENNTQVMILQNDLENTKNALQEKQRACTFIEEKLFQETELRAKLSEKASRVAVLEEELLRKQEALDQIAKECSTHLASLADVKARLEDEKKLSNEKLALLSSAQKDLTMAFKAISSDALKNTQVAFFDSAKQFFEKYQNGIDSEMKQKHTAFENLVKPLNETLQKVDTKIQDLEKTRLGAYVSVTEQLKMMASSQIKLQTETANLVKALRTPNVRGMWGEMQLRRVVEMAGMVAYCDFFEQVNSEKSEQKMRPDLMIQLPNSRSIIVDAKAPLHAYLEATECEDEEVRTQKLKDHARQLKKHLTQLGEKEYWENFGRAPEFVVLFLPAESFFSMALEQDPSLIEYGVSKKVILATPTTLIALLKAVAYGWREEQVQEHAMQISELGKELYIRLQTMTEHFIKLKRSIDSCCDSYNKAIGSFETRVLVAARRFQDVGVGQQRVIPTLDPIEKMTRSSHFETEMSIN